MTHCQVASLLEKMNSSDKDFRFMATTDLMTELQKPSIKLDDEIERKIVKMLLNLLEDKNGEVQNLAVKCLGPLVSRVKNIHVEYIVDTLCKNMISDKDQLRDISSIGLKTVIVDLPKSSPELISVVCNNITGKLTDVIQKRADDVSVQLEALDILSDILSRFGNQLNKFYTSIQEALLPLLESQRSAVRKRAITALAHLLTCCELELFNETITFLLKRLNEHSQGDFTLVPTYIQCLAAISRLCGQRFGAHLQEIVPFIVKLSANSDDELKEYCIQVFDAFLRKAPKEITPYVPQISEICLKYLCHDPNYNYDDGEDDEEMELDGDFENDESNDEYSDDDDISWKVRRQSAKCIEALISTRHDMMIDLYKNVSPILIQRYKEREENVKVDVFNAYIALLKQTRVSNYQSNPQEDSPLHLLQNQVPNIIKTLHKQLKEKSVKTRQGSFSLLLELINVLPGCLNDHLEILVPGILYSLNDKNSTSNMKIDTLVFLNALFKTHPAEIFYPHLQQLLPAVIASVDDSFYKISSEALVVLTQMIKVIRPSPSDQRFANYIEPIYKCTFSKLQASDLDQEVKERAITCMGQLINTFGDIMQNNLDVALALLVERLKNEITRLTSIKAFIMIASSPFRINFAPYLTNAIPILADFLRKNQRTLKISSLILLDTLVKNYGNDINSQVIENVLIEIPQLISEGDLYISQLALTLLTSLIRSDKANFPIITDKILQQTLVLVRSPLLQGLTLQSLLDFFQILVLKSFPNLNFEELLLNLIQPVYKSSNLHKQAYHSIAKCVSAISIVENKRALETVKRFIKDIVANKNQDSIQAFALLTIGEIGKRVDLSSIGQLKELLISALGSPSEEVKSAASFALGSVSVGNLEVYLPFVLSEIEKRDKKHYLLLHSLKEIISCQSTNSTVVQTLNPYVESIWSLLINHCQCQEEGTRNVVAECLGKLIIINPTELLPKLQSYLKNESALARSTVVTAMKFTISEQPQEIDPLLKECIGDFLRTLEDEDLNVRRVALVAFNSAAHNKPSLVRNLLDQLLPQLYKETKVRTELIREVEMGPFKHTVDDGLDLRKAAFECMYTLLDSCLDRIDIFEFLNHVESGLKDHSDIKMLTYLMLIRLSNLCPSAVLNRIDSLVEPLKSICVSKVKSNAVKQENEKLEEMKRSALRAFLALVSIPDADKSTSIQEFLNIIKTNEELQALHDQVQNDNISSVIGDSVQTSMEVN